MGEINACQCWEAHAKKQNPRFFATMHQNTQDAWQRVADMANAAVAAERARVVARIESLAMVEGDPRAVEVIQSIAAWVANMDTATPTGTEA